MVEDWPIKCDTNDSESREIMLIFRKLFTLWPVIAPIIFAQLLWYTRKSASLDHITHIFAFFGKIITRKVFARRLEIRSQVKCTLFLSRKKMPEFKEIVSQAPDKSIHMHTAAKYRKISIHLVLKKINYLCTSKEPK